VTDVTIQSLHIYPIKSTSGIALPVARVGAMGLTWVRRWALIGADGEVLTAREHPRLLEITTEITPEGLTVEHAGRERFRLPLGGAGTAVQAVTVFGSSAGGLAVGEEIDEWLSALLQTPCRLVFMDRAGRRAVSSEHGGRGDDAMSYADQCPLLLISQASLDDLNNRLETPVTIKNFRPNIVVAGCDPYSEDQWPRIEVAGVTFDVVQQCQRCVFTTIDPDTGERHPLQEPLRTLSQYRRHPQGGVAFGVHLIPRGVGELTVGDCLSFT